TYPFLLQSFLAKFGLEDPNFKKELAAQNILLVEIFHMIKWLVKPQPPKAHRLLIINLFDKLLAAKIGREDLVLDGYIL
ncbi:hypothetical protein CROQUDRAFT_53639, partial [Cronartium quercuum f. sp. fusiforme G11]